MQIFTTEEKVIFFFSSPITSSFRRILIFLDDRRHILESRKQNLFLGLQHSLFLVSNGTMKTGIL